MFDPLSEFRLLMGRVRRGCPAAARELHDRYSDHLRRIVRRHGGNVWGSGAVEKGATFYLELQ